MSYENVSLPIRLLPTAALQVKCGDGSGEWRGTGTGRPDMRSGWIAGLGLRRPPDENRQQAQQDDRQRLDNGQHEMAQLTTAGRLLAQRKVLQQVQKADQGNQGRQGEKDALVAKL